MYFQCDPIDKVENWSVVPPTGAKGLNLAAGDVVLLSRAIGESLPCPKGE
jgi:hypothetical protein